jgi:hypothetical protein
MASRSPGPGELVAGAGGVLLLLTMFLPWFGVDSSARLPDGQVIDVGGGNVNAWQAFSGTDLILAAAAIVAIALLAASYYVAPPTPLTLATIGLAAFGAMLIVVGLISAPDLVVDPAEDTAYETGRRLGAFLGLLCTAAIAWGANRAEATAAVEAPAPAEPAPPVEPAEPAPPVEPAEPAPPVEPAEPAPPAPAPPAPAAAPPAPPAPEPARRPRRPRPAAPSEPAPAAAATASAGPLGGWTRAAIDAECESAWRRYDRRLSARYARYFEEHPDLVGESKTAARDLTAALPSGWADLAEAVPADAWDRQHLSGKSSQALAVGMLGVAARRDPSLAWLWDALDLRSPEAGEPVLEFEHVVAPDLLGERPRQTSFDVLVDDPDVLVGIEAKWRERGIGACLCRGDGAGPGAGLRCSRRIEQRDAYWEAAGAALGIDARGPGAPCPISPLYESVRHAAALRALAGERHVVLLLLHDSHNPYFAGAEGWPGWPNLLAETIGGELRFAALSWQELAPQLPLDDAARDWAADKHGLD